MGTNYYHITNVCHECGRGDERKHIGKSSYGWAFALHVEPADGITSLADWRERWDLPDSKIVEEYGNSVTPVEMLECIVGRRREMEMDESSYWYSQNFAVPDKENNLARHKLDSRHCIGHGDGTYDLMVGEFD